MMRLKFPTIYHRYLLQLPKTGFTVVTLGYQENKHLSAVVLNRPFVGSVS